MTGSRSRTTLTPRCPVPCHLSSPVPLYPVTCTLYPIPYAAMPTLQQEAREAILSRAENNDLRRMLCTRQDDRIALPRDLFLFD